MITMSLNPEAQAFTPRFSPLSPKAIFLQTYYPNYPRNYIDHVIAPALDSGNVPHLSTQPILSGDAFHAMLAGREAAATELYLRINEKRKLTYSHILMKPVAAHMVLEMRRSLAGRENVENDVEVDIGELEPWGYGFAGMVFHTIFMIEGDLARLVRGVRAVLAIRERTNFAST
jgi:hypothetical protein